MEANISIPGSSFTKALRSFQTGGFSYEDFLIHVNRQLTAGASRAELLEILRRRQLIEPLPEYAHETIARLLKGAAKDARPESVATRPAAVAADLDIAAAVAVAPAPREAIDSVPQMNAAPQSAPAPTPIAPALPKQSLRRMGPASWLTAAAIVVVAGLVVGYLSSWKIQGSPAPVAQPAPPPAPLPTAGTVLTDCPACPQMTVLPKGRFKQGAPYDDREASAVEKPRHVVIVRAPFAISTNEVTVSEFTDFIAATGRTVEGCTTFDGQWHDHPKASWKDPAFSQDDNSPVTCVSWNDAVAYAEWLSGTSGRHYRLPSASEWEYAARAGSEAVRPWESSTDACSNANVADQSAAHRYRRLDAFDCKDGYVNTAPVGSFKPNAFGLNDMPGNVSQWTQDCWHENYAKAPIDTAARLDGDCAEHELRGVSWSTPPASARLSYRAHSAADYRSSSLGFRIVRDLGP